MSTAMPHVLRGRLVLSNSGWLKLEVPNAFMHGAFRALKEPGIELPPSTRGNAPDAHISVMRPEEIAQIGGPSKITERGKEYAYSLGAIKSVEPTGWAEMSRCWMYEVFSPELEQLRKTYGLSALPNEGKFAFHVTFAVRRKNVLYANDTSKGSPQPNTDTSGQQLFKFSEDWVNLGAPIFCHCEHPDRDHDLLEKVSLYIKGMGTGIPDREDPGDLSKLQAGQLINLIIQLHDAKRAGCFGEDAPVRMADGTECDIRDVAAGDMVAVPGGIAKVKRLWDNGTGDAWFRVTAGGRSVLVTPQHPYWVADCGWLPIHFLEGREARVDDNGQIRIGTETQMACNRILDADMPTEMATAQRQCGSVVCAVPRAGRSAVLQNGWRAFHVERISGVRCRRYDLEIDHPSHCYYVAGCLVHNSHYDFRMGTPDTNLFSWATRKELPDPKGKIALYQQPLHHFGYGQFQGTLRGGYGAGTVKKHREGELLLTKVEPGKIEFTTSERHPERFALIKPQNMGEKTWLLVNSTPSEAVPYNKVHYTKVPADQVEPLLKGLLPGSSVQAKIDGAASLTELKEHGIEVMSYRTSKETGRPIFHTERIFHGRPGLATPKDLVGTILKGELYGTQQKDNAESAIPVQELGGLLNSAVGKSIKTQKERNIQLKNMLYDIQQRGKEPIDMATVPYAERMKMVQEIAKLLPQNTFQASEEATTPEDAQALWLRIKNGMHPLTREGIVIHPPTGVPMKAKLLDDADVHVTGVFPGEGKYQGTGAGGFDYSMEPGGPTLGRVGTGLTDEVRRELWQNPDLYKGRVARIRHQGAFPETGALRAPSFLGWHQDYPMTKTAADTTQGLKPAHLDFNVEPPEDSPEDTRTYRDRVEVYATRGNKILGGRYLDDRTHGVFGGGIEAGEDPIQTAVREYAEEAGYRLLNPRMLPVEPHEIVWHPNPDRPADRNKKYLGSRTHFATGEIGDTVPDEERGEDTRSSLDSIRFRALLTALKATMPSRCEYPSLAKARRSAIRHLINETQKTDAVKAAMDDWYACGGNKELYKHKMRLEGAKVDKDPTEAQIEAGNYRHGHVHMHGFRISIENPKGGTRSGTSKSGKAWSITMKHAHGYICGTKGADKDHLDVFVGEHPHSELIFVVDQIDPSSKLFDEHKVMLGFTTKDDAKQGYLANYEDGWKGLGKITGLTMDQFKTWLADGVTHRPVAAQTFEMTKAAGDDCTVFISEEGFLVI